MRVQQLRRHRLLLSDRSISQSLPLSLLYLVCLDKGDQLSLSDKMASPANLLMDSSGSPQNFHTCNPMEGFCILGSLRPLRFCLSGLSANARNVFLALKYRSKLSHRILHNTSSLYFPS